MHRSHVSAIGRWAMAGALLTGLALAGGLQRSPGQASAAGPVTLTFYDGGLYTPNKSTMAIIAGYHKLHPNVTIKIIPYSGNYVTDISTALAGGTAADVVVPTAMQQIWTDVAKGYWEDLTPYVTRPDPYLPHHESLASALDPGVLDSQRYYDGKLYALATTAVDCAFFYNKSIFAQAGISGPPATWAQFIDDLQKIKATGHVPLELPLGDTAYSEPVLTLLASLESEVMGRTIARLDQNHNGIVDIRELATGMKDHVYSASDPEYQEALRLYAQLYPYLERGAAGVSYKSGQTAFAIGRAAIYLDGMWGVSTIDSAKPSFQFGFFPVPQVTKASSRYAYPGTHGTGVWGSSGAIAFGVPTTTAKRGHMALAIDFMEYLMSYQNTAILKVASTAYGVLKGISNDERYAAFENIGAHLSPLAFSEETMPPQWTVLRQQLLIDYLTGQKSWNDMLSAMQASMTSNANQVLTSYHLR